MGSRQTEGPAAGVGKIKTAAEAEEVLAAAAAQQQPSGASAATVWAWEEDGATAARTTRKCTRLACCATEPVGGAEAGGKKFASCARCGARFCSRDCQVADWKRGGCHKAMCPQVAAFRDGGFGRDQRRDAVLRGCLGRVRMYAFPHFVCHRALKGDTGALFLQSSDALEDFFFDGPVNRHGEPQRRAIFVAYVAEADFDDAGLGLSADARAALRGAAAGCEGGRAAVLCKFRCGAVAVFSTDIVPALPVCNALARDYEDQPVLQLNVDDGL